MFIDNLLVLRYTCWTWGVIPTMVVIILLALDIVPDLFVVNLLNPDQCTCPGHHQQPIGPWVAYLL